MKHTGFKFSWGLLFLHFLSVIQFSEAIDETSAEESSCFKPNTVIVNETWMASIDKWYYPLASRLDLYRSAHDLLETNYENIPEYSLYYDSCLHWTLQSDGYTLMGYNGKSRRLSATSVSDGIADFKSEWAQGMKGRAYTTLTDNSTFVFFAACFADNQMSWNVFSATETLDDATKEAIYDHALSLGYNAEYFTELRYDSCRKNRIIKENFEAEKSRSSGEHRTLTSLSGTNENHAAQKLPKKQSVEHGFFFCSACLKVCPNLEAKNPVAERYFQKLEKHRDFYDKA